MAQIRWTEQAAADLEAITEFIAADSPQYAQLFALDIIKAIERLAAFPRLVLTPQGRCQHSRNVRTGET